MSEQIIAINVPKNKAPFPAGIHEEPGLGEWGRPELATELYQRGAMVAFTRSAYDTEANEVVVAWPRTISAQNSFAEGTTLPTGVTFAVSVEPGTIALDAIGAIRNVSAALGRGLPELNDPAVRELARDKFQTDSIFWIAGFEKDFIDYDPATESLEDVFDKIPSDIVVIKPRFGRASEAVHVGTKSELAKNLAGQMPELKKPGWMIEEYFEAAPMEEIRGADETQQAIIDVANQAPGTAREIRSYTFGRDNAGKLLQHYVLRVGAIDALQDRWVYVDQDSIPREVVDGTDRIAQAFEEQTGVSEMHLGADWFKTKQAGFELWLPGEVNAAEPQLVRQRERPDVAKLHAGLLAEQLIRVAKRGGTK